MCGPSASCWQNLASRGPSEGATAGSMLTRSVRLRGASVRRRSAAPGCHGPSRWCYLSPRGSSRMNQQALSAFIWSVADLLRGDYKPADYGKVILPFTVLRRLDCVLEPTKAAVLEELAKRKKAGLNPEPFLLKKAGQLFYNTSKLDLKQLMGDQDNIGENL